MFCIDLPHMHNLVFRVFRVIAKHVSHSISPVYYSYFEYPAGSVCSGTQSGLARCDIPHRADSAATRRLH